MRRFSLLFALAVGLSPAANIVLNSSFETWLAGVPLGWLSSELLRPGSAVQDSNSHTGTWCVRLESADTVAFVTSATIVRPGYSYEFAGWVRAPGVVGGSFILQFTQLNATPVGSPVLIPAVYSGSSYREYTHWVTAPDSAAFLSITFGTLSGFVAYVDDVTLEDTSIAALAEGVPGATPRATPARKLVAFGNGCRVPAGSDLYDATGRRLASRPRRGVFFIVPH